MAIGTSCSKPIRFRQGDLVQVRSQSEILATLDSDGRLEGLPFMPELAKFCGRRFRVYRRAEKVFLDYYYYMGQMKNAVFLEGVRCDGESHEGCGQGCLIFWKEAWLRPVQSSDEAELNDLPDETMGKLELPATNGDGLCCQATALVDATSRLPWWDPRQYVRDLVSKQRTPKQLASILFLVGYNKLQRMRGRKPYGAASGHANKTPTETLDLKPGELVEVKSKEEIEATLDVRGRNRGLGFTPDMARFRGGQYRVAKRVDKTILEWSGEMCRLGDTVSLEKVTCSGIAYRGCPRDCYHLWREIWLKRVL